MELDDALAFIAGHHHGVLSTRRKNGEPQMSPVSAGVVGGRIVVSTRASLAKVHNIARDPAVSMLAFTDSFFGGWVQVDGQAEIIRQPEALELLDEVYRSIAGEHPDWAEYRAAMIRDDRVVISLTGDRAAGRLG